MFFFVFGNWVRVFFEFIKVFWGGVNYLNLFIIFVVRWGKVVFYDLFLLIKFYVVVDNNIYFKILRWEV